MEKVGFALQYEGVWMHRGGNKWDFEARKCEVATVLPTVSYDEFVSIVCSRLRIDRSEYDLTMKFNFSAALSVLPVEVKDEESLQFFLSQRSGGGLNVVVPLCLTFCKNFGPNCLNASDARSQTDGNYDQYPQEIDFARNSVEETLEPHDNVGRSQGTTNPREVLHGYFSGLDDVNERRGFDAHAFDGVEDIPQYNDDQVRFGDHVSTSCVSHGPPEVAAAMGTDLANYLTNPECETAGMSIEADYLRCSELKVGVQYQNKLELQKK